jgi:hypothetical protein
MGRLTGRHQNCEACFSILPSRITKNQTKIHHFWPTTHTRPIPRSQPLFIPLWKSPPPCDLATHIFLSVSIVIPTMVWLGNKPPPQRKNRKDPSFFDDRMNDDDEWKKEMSCNKNNQKKKRKKGETHHDRTPSRNNQACLCLPGLRFARKHWSQQTMWEVSSCSCGWVERRGGGGPGPLLFFSVGGWLPKVWSVSGQDSTG